MIENLKSLWFLCPILFLAGFVDSIAGGGGLISLPAYLAAGIPPHFAVATNKCSSVFGVACATIQFWKEKKIHWKSALSASATSLCGSFLGATLSLIADEKYLRYLLILAVPIVSVFVLTKKDFGAKETRQLSSKKVIQLSLLTGLVCGIYDGFFGPGVGTFLIFIFTAVIGFDMVTACGNTKVVNLASNVAAFITFAIGGKILWQIGIPAAVCHVAGNFVGSRLAIANGNKIVRPMFFVSLVLLMGKVVYDTYIGFL